MKENIVVVFIVFIILSICFIFSNSLKGPEATMADSNFFLDIIYSVVNRFIDVDYDKMSFLVRKCAHMTEFCILGIFLCCLTLYIKRNTRKNLFGYTLFVGLLTAVTDEHIQRFTGRTSSTTDIFIDFTGLCIGIVGVILLNLLIGYIMSRVKRKNRLINIKEKDR